MKTTTKKVLEYVTDCPGCTSRDIIADLDLKPQTVRMTLKRFQINGIVRSAGRDTNGLVFWWPADATVVSKESNAPAKQETVSSWPTLTIPKQNIFSALGL